MHTINRLTFGASCLLHCSVTSSETFSQLVSVGVPVVFFFCFFLTSVSSIQTGSQLASEVNPPKARRAPLSLGSSLPDGCMIFLRLREMSLSRADSSFASFGDSLLVSLLCLCFMRLLNIHHSLQVVVQSITHAQLVR